MILLLHLIECYAKKTKEKDVLNDNDVVGVGVEVVVEVIVDHHEEYAVDHLVEDNQEVVRDHFQLAGKQHRFNVFECVEIKNQSNFELILNCRSRSRSFSGSLRGSPFRDFSPRHSPPRRRGPSRYRSPIRSPPRSVEGAI